MSDSLAERRSRLSSAKRALLEKRLAGIRDEAQHAFILPAMSGVIPHAAQQASYPLSFGQERMWFLNRLDPASPAYNRPLAIRLQGPLNLSILEWAISEIIRRHQVLRTTYHLEGFTPQQKIQPAQSFQLRVHDLNGEQAPEDMCHQISVQKVQQPFDLTQGPMLRGDLFRLEPFQHVLLLVFHHIAFDVWSSKIFVRELSLFYDVLVHGETAPLEDLPIQYVDYAVWQRQMGEELIAGQLSYWVKKLSGLPPGPGLLADRSRSSSTSTHGATHFFSIPGDILSRLQAFSRQQEATLFMALLAAFQVLLYRYTGQRDISVGVPAAGRSHSEFEALIGLFINTLVFHTSLPGNASFRQLLETVRREALEVYAHQDLPFERLVQELNPQRTLRNAPLFQVMFNLKNVPEPILQSSDLKFEPFEFDDEIAQFDLSFDLLGDGITSPMQGGYLPGLPCKLVYNTDLFDRGRIERMAEHYLTLLVSLLADPDQSVDKLEILSAGERQQILHDFNHTQVTYLEHLYVHQLVEAQAERTPEAVAVICGDRQLTYCQLNQRANRLARFLQHRGMEQETIVAILLPRSIELVVAMLAVWKAGGAFLLLDPEYPQARLDYMLQDSGAHLLLAASNYRRQAFYQGEVLNLNQEHTWLDANADNLPSTDQFDCLAYIFYTSGSTGWPKGVMITYANIANFCNSFNQIYGLKQNTVALQVTSISFDASMRDFWGPLTTGGSVHLLEGDHSRSPTHILSTLREHKANSILSLAPTMLRLLLDEADEGKEMIGALKMLLVSGECLHLQDWERARAILGDDLFMVNQYGPTETTLISTCYPIPLSARQDGDIWIGKPIGNVRIYILDANLSLVPVGVQGEIYIAGLGVGRGYLNLPEKTAASFLPNPYAIGERMYRTGDLGRYRLDGNIEFLGRLDSQVKLRGQRVELDGIEALMQEKPEIRQCAARLWLQEDRDLSLVAYLVLEPGREADVQAWRSYLRERLPEVMIPSHFIILDRLPVGLNGKVDRLALPSPGREHTDELLLVSSPRNSLEKSILVLWLDLLEIQQTGIYDNFFELGGHSLLAVRLLTRVLEEYHVDIPLHDFLTMPTIANLAVMISQQQSDRKAGENE
ncbi:MAG: amino acid adenylation domain-containing protein [Anaerolineales bacterium]|nr:amino acid adenylation domain-containing protein [Anaerolineales bacterium]